MELPNCTHYPSTIYFTFIWTLSAIDPCHYHQRTRVESVPLEVVESCSPWGLLFGPFTGPNLLRKVLQTNKNTPVWTNSRSRLQLMLRGRVASFPIR